MDAPQDIVYPRASSVCRIRMNDSSWLMDFWFLEEISRGGLLLPFLLLWVVGALAVGMVAGRRGRSRFVWTVASILATPIGSILLLSVLQWLGKRTYVLPVETTDLTRCPACKDVVSDSLSYCPDCGEELPSRE